MTDTKYTHLTLVVDRSGSMATTCDDAQAAINKLFEDQRKVEGKLTVNLSQFDTEHDDLYVMEDIAKVDGYVLQPRGGTALLDAVGRQIIHTGSLLAAFDEDKRPGQVVFVVVTDGFENSSREFRLAQIKAMIKEQRETWKWDFLFLGAAEAAWAGNQMGSTVSVTHANTGQGYQDVYAAASSNLANVRSFGARGQSVSMADTWVDNEGTQRLSGDEEESSTV